MKRSNSWETTYLQLSADIKKAFNDKFGEKDEEDLTETEKTEMDSLLKKIEGLQAEIGQLQQETTTALEKFQQLVNLTKQRLGIN